MTHIRTLLKVEANVHHVLAAAVEVTTLMQVPCGHYKAAYLPWKQTFDGWMGT